jgi:hypothetical protein
MYKIYHRYGLLSIFKAFLGTSKVAKWDNLLLGGSVLLKNKALP